MPRGQLAKVGDTRIAQNGYHYTRTKEAWRLTHHIIAERKIGRPLRKGERVVFIDGDRKNMSPGNLRVVVGGQASLSRRIAMLEAEIEEKQAALDELRRQMKAGSTA